MSLASRSGIILGALMLGGCWLTESFDDLGKKSSDAGSPPSPPGTPPPPAASFTCGGTTLCQSFEADDPSFWDVRDGNPTIDSANARNGKSSLHLHTGDSLRHTGALGTTFFIRLFLFVPQITGTAPSTFLVVAHHASFDTTNLRIDNRRLGSGDSLSNNYPTTDKAFPTNTWQCVELASDGTVYLGDTPQAAINTPPLEDVRQLFLTLAGPSVSEVWIDELVIAPTHVGCTSFQ